MRRWVCPRCGSGVNAPAAPHADDARRFCLSCTGATGRLVRRTCPALDQRRADKAATAKARRTATKARADQKARAAVTVAGAYLPDVVAKCWRALGPWRRQRAAFLMLSQNGSPPEGYVSDQVPTAGLMRRSNAHRPRYRVYQATHAIDVIAPVAPPAYQVWAAVARGVGMLAAGMRTSGTVWTYAQAVEELVRRLWRVRLGRGWDIRSMDAALAKVFAKRAGPPADQGDETCD